MSAGVTYLIYENLPQWILRKWETPEKWPHCESLLPGWHFSVTHTAKSPIYTPDTFITAAIRLIIPFAIHMLSGSTSLHRDRSENRAVLVATETRYPPAFPVLVRKKWRNELLPSCSAGRESVRREGWRYCSVAILLLRKERILGKKRDPVSEEPSRRTFRSINLYLTVSGSLGTRYMVHSQRTNGLSVSPPPVHNRYCPKQKSSPPTIALSPGHCGRLFVFLFYSVIMGHVYAAFS